MRWPGRIALSPHVSLLIGRCRGVSRPPTPNPPIIRLPYDHIDAWTMVLPPHTRWSQLLCWIDRYESRVYRLADSQLRLWLPASVGEGWLTVWPEGEEQLALTLHHAGQPARQAVEAFLRAWWDLDRDLAPFYRAFAQDDLLGPLLARHHGARIVGFPDLFEALVIGILGQQVNVAFAYTLKHRLTEAYGQSREQQGEVWWRFPRPADLAGASVAALRQMQVSQRKAEYLLGVAEAMHTGQLDKAQLLQMDFEAQVEALTALRGIGNWTAQYVCLKCLHSLRAFPAGDVGLQNSVKQLLHMARKPSVEELYELAHPWQGWEAYATWFLWMGR